VAFAILFVVEAQVDLDSIRPFDRRRILDDIELHLQFAPARVSRARIKRLRSTVSPTYRLRIADYRVFYDVDERAKVVTVLRVLSKEQSVWYLGEAAHEDDSSREPE
jgi:mRNA-degrading endonuclease RelE of RelBE toxin-antitoxin system